jgi:hypothetical protein
VFAAVDTVLIMTKVSKKFYVRLEVKSYELYEMRGNMNEVMQMIGKQARINLQMLKTEMKINIDFFKLQ